jgi:hypothetical protein
VFRFSATASMTVVGFQGAANSLAGAAIANVSKGTGIAGDPTASITTTRANSLVFGVGTDWDGATARTLGANQTIVHQYLATVGDTYWVQRTNSIPASGTRITITDTYGTTMPDRWNLAVIEIRRQ